jgi:hypothetical protein
MSFFAPFSYREQKVVTPAIVWDPSEFTNVQYWWRADTNVTTGTGGVTTWTDQINSYDLQQSNSSDRPSSTTNANLNNQDVVSFNGTSDFLFATTSPASLSNSDFTHIAVYDLKATTGQGLIVGWPYISAGSIRTWYDLFNGNLRLFEQGIVSTGGTGLAIESPVTTGVHTFKVRYDSDNGDGYYAYDTLTETLWGSSGLVNGDWNANVVTCMGATLNSISNPTVFSSRYATVDIAEWVVIYGTPSTDEMTQWSDYINTRYGISL